MSDAIYRENCLEDGYVELLDFMGDEDAPVDAARVSFGKRAAEYPAEANERLTQYLLDHNHGTPFEMVTFKFRVRAPVIVWWQWVRHRIASYNFISGRYVPFEETEVHTPMAWRLQDPNAKQGSLEDHLPMPKGLEFSERRDHLYALAFALYKDMLEAGVAREQARLVLPFGAVYYDAIVQMNARSLMNFLSLRLDGHAQSEIREYAEAIRQIVSKTHPRLFS